MYSEEFYYGNGLVARPMAHRAVEQADDFGIGSCCERPAWIRVRVTKDAVFQVFRRKSVIRKRKRAEASGFREVFSAEWNDVEVCHFYCPFLAKQNLENGRMTTEMRSLLYEMRPFAKNVYGDGLTGKILLH